MIIIIIFVIIAILCYIILTQKNIKKLIYFNLIYPIKQARIKQLKHIRSYEKESQQVIKNTHQIDGSCETEISSQGFLQYMQYEEDLEYFKEQLVTLKTNVIQYLKYTNTKLKQKDIYRLNKIRNLLYACGKIQVHKFKDANGNKMEFPFIRIQIENTIYPTIHHYLTDNGFKTGYLEDGNGIESNWDKKDFIDNRFNGYCKKIYHTNNIVQDLDTGDLNNYCNSIFHKDNEISNTKWNEYIALKNKDRNMQFTDWKNYINSEIMKQYDKK